MGILGPNGSGKTTLLKVLATLTSLTSGNIKVFGFDLVKNGGKIRQMVGYLAHESFLYSDLTGEENIRFYYNFYQPSKEKIQERLDETFNLLKIARWKDEPVKNLSRGLRKRFDLVRAIVHDPMILLLDEPFSSLDIDSSNILESFINKVKQDKTVVTTTHDIEHAKRICDRAIILVNGKICQVLDAKEITETSVKEVFRKGA